MAFMHPARILAASLLPFFLLTLLGCGDISAQQGPGAAAPPPEVTVVKIAPEKVTVFEEYVGQTDAADTVEIRSRVMALLDRQAVPDGMPVRKGQLLFVLDREPLAAALDQARAQLAVTEANAANSRQVRARIEPLAKEQAVSQQDLDNAIARERADAAAVEVARAQVRTAELNLSYTQIFAPRDGVLSRAQVRPGGMVMQGTTLLATLYSSDPMYVNFTVPEGRAFEFQKRLATLNGKDGALPFAILLPDGSAYKRAPKLNFVDPVVDAKSGTLQVRLAVPNPERQLKAGLFVKVRAPAYEADNAVRIPGRAVTEILGRRSVYIVQPDGKFEARELVDARRGGQDWIVEKGFKPGELVIVEGTARIRPGLAAVKPVPPKPPAVPGATAGGGAPAGTPPSAVPEGKGATK
jgi:membrane fusion protein (multidrug efflux system)